MLNQIEEKEKHEQIKTKLSIKFISEAWRKVSEETIKNCRRHADIINALNNEQWTFDSFQTPLLIQIFCSLNSVNTSDDKFIDALNKCLQYYEDIEEYEKCAFLKKILDITNLS
jgi:hypothetical protein